MREFHFIRMAIEEFSEREDIWTLQRCTCLLPLNNSNNNDSVRAVTTTTTSSSNTNMSLQCPQESSTQPFSSLNSFPQMVLSTTRPTSATQFHDNTLDLVIIIFSYQNIQYLIARLYKRLASPICPAHSHSDPNYLLTS